MFNFPISPPQASNFAVEYDAIFYALTILTVVFTVLVAAMVLFFAVRYRRGTKASRKNPVYHSTLLEAIMSGIPLILGIIMFFFGAKLFISMRTPPKDATEIFVVGKQWMWHAQHPNGVRENNTLHVPVGKPVRLVMISQDVIHAFYIPAFRVQMHVVPGRYTQLHFTATKAGTYHLFCAMYCGTQHSEMGGRVVAMEPKEYAAWLANGGEYKQAMSMEQMGAKIAEKVGCNNCHGGQDSIRAPSLYALPGRKRTMTDGSVVTADQDYVRESILRPWNKINAGYDRTMPAYEGQLTEEEVLNLLAYIRGLGSPASTPVPSAQLGAGGNGPGAISGRSGLAVGALNVNAERAAPTPTTVSKAPGVGAYAAELEKN